MFNAEFDDRPEKYDALRHCWLNRRRLQFLVTYIGGLQLDGGSRVLEVGSGTGALLRKLAAAFPQFRFVGIDPLETYVQYARQTYPRENLRFVRGRGENIDRFLSGPFDLVLSNDVLHHLDSESDTLSAVFKVTAGGGRWLLIEPNCLNLYSLLRATLRAGERNFYPRFFRRSAKRTGWSYLQHGYIFLIPPFVTDASAWMIRLEKLLERTPPLAGGIWMELER